MQNVLHYKCSRRSPGVGGVSEPSEEHARYLHAPSSSRIRTHLITHARVSTYWPRECARARARHLDLHNHNFCCCCCCCCCARRLAARINHQRLRPTSLRSQRALVPSANIMEVQKPRDRSAVDARGSCAQVHKCASVHVCQPATPLCGVAICVSGAPSFMKLASTFIVFACGF